MENSEWYKLQAKCKNENNSETIRERSDVLICKKFGGSCMMLKCVAAHNNQKKD